MTIYLLLLLLFNWTANGILRSGTTVRHNTQIHISHKITHHAQTKHSTQKYTNNKGHITHNAYNTTKVKLSLQQAVRAYRVVRCQGAQIVWPIDYACICLFFSLYVYLIYLCLFLLKLVSLIKMCLNVTYSKVRIGNHLSDSFPNQNGLKQGVALSPLLFNFALKMPLGRSRKSRWDWDTSASVIFR
jgi:hypothetical protein